ncbi:MAG TPA: DUF3800 domain-containing protein [Bryobacteraceae bacterium]|nr:DUF3800 domain-containing protein [Bryobacteraceae bacterium]
MLAALSIHPVYLPVTADMASGKKQKLYCYVDETGQDPSARFFIVVAIVAGEEQESLREALTAVERSAGTGHKKWHKIRSESRLRYLERVLQQSLAAGKVFYGCFEKPVPYFFPFVEVLERGIKAVAGGNYIARVCIDGIDRQKAKELTSALRSRGISLKLVKGARDESEALIRLADMWAGCIRAALGEAEAERRVLDQALGLRHVRDVS